MKRPVLLMILDGFGLSNSDYGNAIQAANTPNLDHMMATYPHTELGASGLDVGLPDGQMGNSEVGHTNIGAGRVVYQELTRITKSIQDGDFFENEELVDAMDHVRQGGGALHLMGLLSDGGVHSHDTHLYALVEMAKRQGVGKVYIHCFTDGRDVPPESGLSYVERLMEKLEEIGLGEIASISGRYYAMDRDNRWDRVEKAYAALVYGEGNLIGDPREVMRRSYEAGITDEFIVPSVCLQGAQIHPGDSVICFNFRPDRAREITRALIDPAFDGFKRRDASAGIHYVCMTRYDDSMPNCTVAFHPVSLDNTFGQYIAGLGLRQLRIAETEKYAHVTFFFNGGMEAPYKGEDRALIPSPQVATYDLKPEMSAYEVTDELLTRLDSDRYDAIILNYANCDMVGHTGIMEAAVAAVEAVDTCIGKILDRVLSMGGVMLLTADHGNADQMKEPDGSPFTAHTTNRVPLIVAGLGSDLRLLPPGEGRLADLTPTMLRIMGLDQPPEMTGKPLLFF